MNQHFNKRNIKAAVRVAFANPETRIYVNGERSKKRYSVEYSKESNELDLFTDGMLETWVYTNKITKSQKSKKEFVQIVTDGFYNAIKRA